MLPIINRGTWTRVFSIRTLVTNFLNLYPEGTELQILSLGAGFDSSFFHHQKNTPEFATRKVKYFEVDFASNTEKKIEIIKRSEELSELAFGSLKPTFRDDGNLVGEAYTLFHCDLRQEDTARASFDEFGLKPEVPTFVIAECLFCYLEPATTEAMVTLCTGYFTGDLSLANYDIQHPDDPFGQMMIANLEKRHCDLLGIRDCPDEPAQEKRLTDCGFTSANATSMIRIHNDHLNSEERSRIEKLEIFDEFEEWELLMSHYLICIGNRTSGTDLTF